MFFVDTYMPPIAHLHSSSTRDLETLFCTTINLALQHQFRPLLLPLVDKDFAGTKLSSRRTIIRAPASRHLHESTHTESLSSSSITGHRISLSGS